MPRPAGAAMAGGPRGPWGLRRHLAGRGRGLAWHGSCLVRGTALLVVLTYLGVYRLDPAVLAAVHRPCCRCSGARQPSCGCFHYGDSYDGSHVMEQFGALQVPLWLVLLPGPGSKGWSCSESPFAVLLLVVQFLFACWAGLRGAAHSWQGAGPVRPCVLHSVPSSTTGLVGPQQRRGARTWYLAVVTLHEEVTVPWTTCCSSGSCTPGSRRPSPDALLGHRGQPGRVGSGRGQQGAGRGDF